MKLFFVFLFFIQGAYPTSPKNFSRKALCSSMHSMKLQKVDQLICESTKLQTLEVKLIKAFEKKLSRVKDKEAFIDEHRNWIFNKRDVKNTPKELEAEFLIRIEQLK